MVSAPKKDASSPGPRKGGTLRELIAWIWVMTKANRWLVVAILVFGALQALFTKVPLLLLKPLLEALQNHGPSHDSSWLMHWSRDASTWICDLFGLRDALSAYDDNGALTLLVGCAALAAICGVLGATTIYGVIGLSRYFATKIVVDLRNYVGAHIMGLPLRFFGVRRMGDLLSNITTDTTVLSRSFALIAEHMVTDPFFIFGNFIILMVCFPEALWVLLLMLPVMALPLIKMGRRVHKRSRRSLVAMGDATESMNQMLSGIKTVKAFQLEKQRLAEFESNNELFLHRSWRMFQAKAVSQSVVFMGYQIGFAAIFAFFGYLVVKGTYSVSDFVVIIAPLATTYQHVKRLSRAYNTLNESAGALDRINVLLREAPDVATLDTGLELEEVRGEVSMEKVCFAYGDDPVVEDLSFHINPGETAALVGPSGAGKSTTLDLLARFHDPISGRVMIDGHDLCDLNLRSYRRHVAIVSQQPFLFNTSILDNIRYGRPDASFDDVVGAAEAAQIHGFITTLPQGYETIAGERGCNLSGGQMQRITIARAILRDPAILFLDEATSSLDSESEGAVQRALANLMRGRTCLVIAHRLSTVSDADKILVLDRGCLVEEGTHAALVEAEGLYHRMSQLQQMV